MLESKLKVIKLYNIFEPLELSIVCKIISLL